MTQAMNTEYQTKEKGHEERLATLIMSGDIRAMDAAAFPILWPHPIVRTSEMPLYFGYLFFQRDLSFLKSTINAPKAAFCDKGEEVYGKWTLAAWFYDHRLLDIQIPANPVPVSQCIPRLWFHPLWLQNQPEIVLNPYEVQLHRLAEAGDIFAQNSLLCAACWPSPHVKLQDLEIFSHATVIREDYYWL